MINVFFELGIIIIVATILAYIAKLIKQPFIPAYIFAGLLLGPIAGLVTNDSTISQLSEIGIACLLFIAGLEIDFNRLKSVGLISILGGGIQILILFGIGYGLGLFFGFTNIVAVYIGLILAFSSTMVVVKFLSDKRELDTHHGRIALGILLMEDFIAITALTILTTINHFTPNLLLISLVKGIGLVIIVLITNKFLFPKLFKIAAKSQELLFLMSLTICFLFALLFHACGFSIAIGAFIAGVGLANLPYNYEIIGKVVPLKDFFSTIFFVSLGLQITLNDLSKIVVPAIILTIIILMIKPMLTMTICSIFGYKKRPAFFVSFILAPVSEFSLIIVAQGITLGHVGIEILSLTIIVAIITITFASYFIEYSEKIFKKSINVLSSFEKLNLINQHLEYTPNKRKIQDIVVCGYNRIGYGIIKSLMKTKDMSRMLIIDFNPEIIKSLIKKNMPCIYGDAGDPEIIERINPKKVKMIISTIPTLDTNYMLLHKLREYNKKAFVIVTANQVDEALKLYNQGADYVILPHLLGGDHVAGIIKKANKGKIDLKVNKSKLIQELQERQSLGHENSTKLNQR